MILFSLNYTSFTSINAFTKRPYCFVLLKVICLFFFCFFLFLFCFFVFYFKSIRLIFSSHFLISSTSFSFHWFSYLLENLFQLILCLLYFPLVLKHLNVQLVLFLSFLFLLFAFQMIYRVANMQTYLVLLLFFKEMILFLHM